MTTMSATTYRYIVCFYFRVYYLLLLHPTVNYYRCIIFHNFVNLSVEVYDSNVTVKEEFVKLGTRFSIR